MKLWYKTGKGVGFDEKMKEMSIQRYLSPTNRKVEILNVYETHYISQHKALIS